MTPIEISIISTFVAIISLMFSIRSWRQTNRPIIYAKITTVSGGNLAICLNITIENVGNRPAKDIQLIIGRAEALELSTAYDRLLKSDWSKSTITI